MSERRDDQLLEQLQKLESKSRTELLALKLDVDVALDRIKAQVDSAKRRVAMTGQYSDGEWFRKATFTLAGYQRASQRIQAAIGEARRKEHEQREASFHAAFIHVAREKLSPETFGQIMMLARHRAKGEERT